MKLAMLSANLGPSNEQPRWAHQDVPGYDVAFHRWTDATFPPRMRCMSSRLQSKIPKCFGWEMAPGYDLYIWLDGTFLIWRFQSARWFVEQLGDSDFGVFAHPNRTSIRQEAEMLRQAVAIFDPYICSRYEGELLEEQLAAIWATYPDDKLFCGGAFIYRNTAQVREMLTEWWVHISRYHVIDQLSLPYVLWKHKIDTKVLPGDFYNGPHLFRSKGNA